MRRIKSTTRHKHMVAARSSSSEDDLSLGADQEEAPVPTRDADLPAWFHSIEAVCFHSGINSPASTRHIGRMTFQCKFVFISVFFSSFNVICGQLINISLILLIFRFTNIEVTRVITSTFKSSMEIPLFQWGQVSKPPDLKPYIDF